MPSYKKIPVDSHKPKKSFSPIKIDNMPNYKKIPVEGNKPAKQPSINLPQSDKKGRNTDSITDTKSRSKFDKAYKEFTKSVHEKMPMFDSKNSFSEGFITFNKNPKKYSKLEENNNFCTRQKKYLELKIEREDKLKIASDMKELSECTFAPSTGPRTHRKGDKGKLNLFYEIENKYDFDQFLHEQHVRETKKMERISKQKEELEEQSSNKLSFQPNIGRTTLEIAQSALKPITGGNIHDRLYKDSKKQTIKHDSEK
jgi:hypothetical protein